MKYMRFVLVVGLLLGAVVGAYWLGARSQDTQTGQTVTTDAGRTTLPPKSTATTEPSRQWPVYIVTMTHLEGDWKEAATNEFFFDHIAAQVRHGLDIAERYGATLTIESEIPFAEGSVAFGDNVIKEALDRGHGVGTHCDIGPKVEYNAAEIVREFKKRKEAVDALVGVENNLGCSGGGGQSDWYAGATGAGFKYLNGTVGFHYLALPLALRPAGWDDRAILAKFFHDPAPQDESYFYPFLISELGFTEDPEGDLLIHDGSLGDVRKLAESQPLGLLPSDAVCGERCPFDAADADAAEAFIRAFVAAHDGSRPGKITIYFPSAAFKIEYDAGNEEFFSRMKSLVNEGLVKWASQREVYDAMMEYYGS
jgi:hypothetical protein